MKHSSNGNVSADASKSAWLWTRDAGTVCWGLGCSMHTSLWAGFHSKISAILKNLFSEGCMAKLICLKCKKSLRKNPEESKHQLFPTCCSNTPKRCGPQLKSLLNLRCEIASPNGSACFVENTLSTTSHPF